MKLIRTRIFHTSIINKVKIFKVSKIVLVSKELNNLMMTKMILMFSTLIKLILTITQLSSSKLKIRKMKLMDQMKQKYLNNKTYNQVIRLSKFLRLINKLRNHKVTSTKEDGVRMNTTDF